MPGKILCVAEKPSISKAVAGHLSGGQFQTVSQAFDLHNKFCRLLLNEAFKQNTRSTYIKNYSFSFDFGGRWGVCDVVMTAVIGHLTQAQFDEEHGKDWNFPPPQSLFSAPVRVNVVKVWNTLSPYSIRELKSSTRTRRIYLPTFKLKQEMLGPCSFGRIVTEKGNISGAKFALRL